MNESNQTEQKPDYPTVDLKTLVPGVIRDGKFLKLSDLSTEAEQGQPAKISLREYRALRGLEPLGDERDDFIVEITGAVIVHP